MELENLPDDLIHKIMHLLPYKEAAKFKVLSKSLHFSWLSFPNLHFNYKSIFSSDLSSKTFFSTVQKTLQLRNPYIKGCLHKLTLSYTKLIRLNLHHYEQVFDVLLNFAIENNIKVLKFNLHIRHSQHLNDITVNWNYDSLRPLFSSQSLTILKLKGVHVPRVDAFITCPKLEELVLERCHGFQTINVSSSSSLKKVELVRCGLQELQILSERKSLNSFKSEGHEEYDAVRQCKLDAYYCQDLKVLKFIDATAITDVILEFEYGKNVETNWKVGECCYNVAIKC